MYAIRQRIYSTRFTSGSACLSVCWHNKVAHWAEAQADKSWHTSRRAPGVGAPGVGGGPGGGGGGGGGVNLVIYRKTGNVSKLHTCERVLTSSAS